jgi:hypothetical protein
MGSLLAIIGLMASNPAIVTLLLKLAPTILKVAKAIQNELLKGEALERLQHDIDATVDAYVLRAARAAAGVTDSVESVETDPGNRDHK